MVLDNVLSRDHARGYGGINADGSPGGQKGHKAWLEQHGRCDEVPF